MTIIESINNLDELNTKYQETFVNEHIVLGEGSVRSSLVIIGEAPGKDEVKEGRPFVGAAGKNLKEFMDIIGISRESAYITNAIKYRLGKVNEKTQRIINRPATKNDIISNQLWLFREISFLYPQIIVTLGNVPLKAVTKDFGASIGAMHGALHKCSIGEKEYRLFPLYHPASIIYNRSLKEVYNIDVLTLKEVLQDLSAYK